MQVIDQSQSYLKNHPKYFQNFYCHQYWQEHTWGVYKFSQFMPKIWIIKYLPFVSSSITIFNVYISFIFFFYNTINEIDENLDFFQALSPQCTKKVEYIQGYTLLSMSMVEDDLP